MKQHYINLGTPSWKNVVESREETNKSEKKIAQEITWRENLHYAPNYYTLWEDIKSTTFLMK